MDMSVSTTGWSIEPDLLSDIRLEIVHSEQFGDYFRVKLGFKNDTLALLEIDIAEGKGINAYEALDGAIRVPRMAPVISGDGDD
jgi:hypothetical protein